MNTPQVFNDVNEISYFVMEISVKYAAYFEKHENEAKVVLGFFFSEK